MIVLMVLALVVLLGFAGLVIDIGRVYVAQRQLQQAVDSAALAAGEDLPDSVAAHASAMSRLTPTHARPRGIDAD